MEKCQPLSIDEFEKVITDLKIDCLYRVLYNILGCEPCTDNLKNIKLIDVINQPFSTGIEYDSKFIGIMKFEDMKYNFYQATP